MDAEVTASSLAGHKSVSLATAWTTFGLVLLSSTDGLMGTALWHEKKSPMLPNLSVFSHVFLVSPLGKHGQHAPRHELCRAARRPPDPHSKSFKPAPLQGWYWVLWVPPWVLASGWRDTEPLSVTRCFLVLTRRMVQWGIRGSHGGFFFLSY